MKVGALLLLAAPLVEGFAPNVNSLISRTPALARARTGLSMVEKVEVDVVSPSKRSEVKAQTSEFVNSAKDVVDQLKSSLNDIDSETLTSDFQAAVEGARKNIQAGKVGERGELVTLIPYLVFAFLLAGDLPYLGGPLEFLAGPGLLVFGFTLTVASVLALGKNLSPWPQPCEGNVLKTSGVYSLCRHPTYAGLVAFGFGLGFATDSFTRIALAAALLYVFDQKATKEEEALKQVHPAYKTYAEEVPKFFPLPSGLNLPWDQK